LHELGSAVENAGHVVVVGVFRLVGQLGHDGWAP
jgi:hypothetical protein